MKWHYLIKIIEVDELIIRHTVLSIGIDLTFKNISIVTSDDEIT